MPTTVYLIRHGEVEAAYRDRFVGTTDAPLSANGEAQIGMVRDFILNNTAGRPPAAIYTSTRQRAIKSASIIADPLGLVPELLPALGEIDFGAWENLTYAQIRERWRAELDAWMCSPFHTGAPGGERLADIQARAVSAFNRITGDHPDETVVIVAHGGVNRIILCHVMGIPGEHIFHLEQDHAAINIISFFDGFPVVKLMNGTLR